METCKPRRPSSAVDLSIGRGDFFKRKGLCDFIEPPKHNSIYIQHSIFEVCVPLKEGI